MGSTHEVLLVRHGETHGYSDDLGLTERGEAEARARGAQLAAELAPGTMVRMPHARSARGTATAVHLRAALLDALDGGARDSVVVEALYPDPWFDNIRFSLRGRAVDTSAAVQDRLRLGEGELPGWATEVDRFDTDYSAGAAHPIDFWFATPTLYFEPPQLTAYRGWQGILAAGADRTENLVIVACTHSGLMRSFAATALGQDPGEPAYLEDIRVQVDPDGGRASVRYRAHEVVMEIPTELPPWLDRAWLRAHGR
jgi:broad specificity phosphatase PhoE